jgi:hypothetical protein
MWIEIDNTEDVYRILSGNTLEKGHLEHQEGVGDKKCLEGKML